MPGADPLAAPVAQPDHEIQSPSRRWWRVAFVLFALTLTIATHWPQLTIGPDVPATDKQIHTAAFALATFLLWMTGWQRRLAVVGAIAVAWAGLDELTQAIPIIQRSCSWLDFAADIGGVALAMLAIWATRRVRGS